MSRRIKLLSLLFAVLLLMQTLLLPSAATADAPTRLPAADSAAPTVSAQSALLMDAQTKDVIWEKEGDLALPMASTTKIMTALTAMRLASPETVLTISEEAVGVEGSSIYLCVGETLTLEQLLYALLLESANDAAVAIAVGLSGSVEAFAAEMNHVAHELGLSNTQFQNPHGLDQEGHYTTARELALISREALNDPLLFQIVSTRKTTIPHDGTDGVRLLINHNKLLRLYEDAIGIKTGYTKKSGRCLVSAAERDGVRLIAVTLNAPNDWQDHTAMLDYGFTKRRAVTLCEPNRICMPISVVGGVCESVMASNPEAMVCSLPTNAPQINMTVEAPRFLYATVEAGKVVGQAVFTCDTDQNGEAEVIARVAITAQTSVQKKKKRSLWRWFCSLFGQ